MNHIHLLQLLIIQLIVFVPPTHLLYYFCKGMKTNLSSGDEHIPAEDKHNCDQDTHRQTECSLKYIDYKHK